MGSVVDSAAPGQHGPSQRRRVGATLALRLRAGTAFVQGAIVAFVLPQFPVGSVVMPHTPVELRVFEQRYLALMGELMVSDRPVFGIPLLGQSVAAGQAPEQLTIGTAVLVDDFGVTDDYMGIQASATKRYVVTRWLEPGPYPRAEVEYLPDLQWDERLESERMLLELDVLTLLARVARHGELLRGADTEVSADPVESVWQLASLLLCVVEFLSRRLVLDEHHGRPKHIDELNPTRCRRTDWTLELNADGRHVR